MSKVESVALLLSGVERWNEWRSQNRDSKLDLSGADLSEGVLSGANLSEVDLSDADLFEVDLSSANLRMAKLSGADLTEASLTGAALYKARLKGACLMGADLRRGNLVEADLSGCDLRGANLTGCDLTEADLSSCNLRGANLSGAILAESDISGSDLRSCDLSDATLTGVHYGTARSMRRHYRGVRGLGSCSGSALFVRDARDQDYLDTVEQSIDEMSSTRGQSWRRFWFKAWGMIDYGRSLARAGLYATTTASIFAFIYFLDMLFGWGLIDYSSSAGTWFSPIYYSIVTYSTLGFGDITPASLLGEMIVVLEVVLGYVTLGLLLSILATKVARRS